MSTRTEPSSPAAKQTLDELVASRTAPKLPAAPVFRREVVPVPEVGRGRKGASDLEAAIRANAEAAEEARRVALAQRRALEEVAAQRTTIEKQLARLRREMAEERSEHERLVAQARYRATQEERRRHDTTADGGSDITTNVIASATPTAPSPAFRAVQGQIAEREQLGESHRQRLLEALRERDAARLELQRVSDARTHAERRLERVTEVLHRATSSSGPAPAGGDGVDTQAVRALRDELAVAIARAKSAESRTNELRDEIDAVKNQRVSTTESLEATRDDLDRARDELGSLQVRLIEVEAEQRKGAPDEDRIEVAQTRARELEAEVESARDRAAAAERQVLELAASLRSTTDRAELSVSVTQDLQRELADAERRRAAAESDAIAVATRMRDAEAAFEARATRLEAQLSEAVIEHGHHAVDLEATHAATAAELTSASAQAEHLAREIDEAHARAEALETELVGRDAELSAVAGELSQRDVRLQETERALAATTAEADVVRARCDELADALAFARDQAGAAETALRGAHDDAGQAMVVAEAALGTARAERDVAVAQADSLTLELAQLRTALEALDAQMAEREREMLTMDTEHHDALTRLDELGRELVHLRTDRDQLVARSDDVVARCEHLELELDVARVRADELEATRSADRRAAEQVIEVLRIKAESATARAIAVESELHDARLVAQARPIELVVPELVVPERVVPEPVVPEPVEASADPLAAEHPDDDAPRAPSELRRAVFASLTELAGDG